MATATKNAESIVSDAGKRWHVPPEIMWGVFGIESDFGKNLGPSSAGARGPFQFLPSTWTGAGGKYGRGRNINDLEASADAAAHYLRDLLQSKGNWDDALRAYSGGGYGLSEVSKKAKGGPSSGGPLSGIPSPGDLLGSVGGSIGDAAAAPFKGLIEPIQDIANVFIEVGDFLIHPRRLLKLTVGSVLLLWGLSAVSKSIGGPHPARGVSRAAKAAAMPQKTAAVKAAKVAKG